MAGYEDSADTSPATHAITDGINIYGNAALNSDDLQYVTLQSAADDPIVLTNESSNIKTSVIDVQNSQNQLVAIVPESVSAVNHSVLGSDVGGNIVFGANARGNNYAKAGSAGTYISNEGGDATLIGGSGNDSILAGDGDYVEGGAGADYFYDANGAYVVRDYSVSDGDVIVATALSDINKNLDAQSLVDQIDADGNSIAIAGGNRITLENSSASSDDTISGLNVIFTDATAKDTHKLTWAPQTGGTVTANAFSEGAVLMVSDNNGGRADSVVGSGDNDTIFVGGNDTVKPGAGKDEIYVTADTSKRQDGAVVVLGDGDRDYIHGWSFGFDNTAGNNVLNADVDKLKYDVKGDTLIAYDSKDTVYFVDNASDTAFDLLVGTPEDATKVTVIKSGNNVITSEDDIADRYYAAPDINATLTFAASVGDIGDTINLGTSKEQNIHSVVLANEGTATLVGSDEKDVVVLSGSAEADARKYVSLGGGNDSIVSGGTETSVTGNTFYFCKINKETFKWQFIEHFFRSNNVFSLFDFMKEIIIYFIDHFKLRPCT